MHWSHHGKFFRGPTTDMAVRLRSRVRYQEPEANRFAAAFLVPAHLAKPSMRADDMCELFHVNISCARFRKESLVRLDRRARGVDRPLPQGIADWLQGQREKGYKVASLDREDVRKRAESKKAKGDGEADK